MGTGTMVRGTSTTANVDHISCAGKKYKTDLYSEGLYILSLVSCQSEIVG